MRLEKNDIDAISLTLAVDGRPAFSILLTRGGLTRRRGSSDAGERNAIEITGRTDRCFEDVLGLLPERLLEQGGAFEDGELGGPRHDWRFEIGGGMTSVVWDVSYHAAAAALPDEFADLVVHAEAATHAWYAAGVAEETGAPIRTAVATPAPTQPRAAAAPGRPKSSAPKGKAAAGRPAVASDAPATRERIALAVFIDFCLFNVPWAYLVAWLADGRAPLGANVVVFAFLEFAILQFARWSPGYWMLGIRAPLGAAPVSDGSWRARESKVTLAVGVGLIVVGVGGLTAWTVFEAPRQLFGLGFLALLSVSVQMLLAVASLVGGALVLRTDLRGVWVGGGASLAGLATALLALRTMPADAGLSGTVVRVVLVAVPVTLLVGLGFTWKRLHGAPAPRAVRPAAR